MKIIELKMSNRTTDVLIKNGITSLEKLCELSKDEVMKLRNMGRMSFTEIDCKMQELNYILNAFFNLNILILKLRR